MAIDDTKRVVSISSNITTGCGHCGKPVGGPDELSASINHYIEAHGYRLLHVGTETIHGPDGQPWSTTVAILGVE